jgi:hypothetical protein
MQEQEKAKNAVKPGQVVGQKQRKSSAAKLTLNGEVK